MRYVMSTCLATLSLLSACATGGAGQAAPNAAGPAVGDDPFEVCRAVTQRKFECRAEYIPALVDLRIKHDLPAGIAAEAALPGGRDRLIETAQKKFDVDGAEPARSAACRAMAPSMRPEMVAAAKACLAKTACADLVACCMPLQEKRLLMSQPQR
jgi:hypothetical protein